MFGPELRLETSARPSLVELNDETLEFKPVSDCLLSVVIVVLEVLLWLDVILAMVAL